MSTATTINSLDTFTFDIDPKIKTSAMEYFKFVGMDAKQVMSNFLTYVATTKDLLYAGRGVMPSRKEMDAEIEWAKKYGKKFKSGEDVLADILN